ncbi:MAG: tRNA adenosine(34) deaminase TadA [Oligoflexus sp.]
MTTDPQQQAALDDKWMQWALSLARSAAYLQEVPVGAVIVTQDRLISTGLNLRETLAQPIAHAELIAIERAAQILGRWRLTDCDLYVTLEPCLMCAGAIYQARFRRVIFGAWDPKGGALGSLYRIHEDKRLNHRYEVRDSVRLEEASKLLSNFFSARRKKTDPS